MLEQKKVIITLAVILSGIVSALMIASPSSALTLVRNGKPAATIVIPAQPLPVESYAARELQYHVKASTGAELKIVSEDAVPSGAHVYLGNCKASAAAKPDLAGLPGNGYVVKTQGDNLYIAGKDGAGDPLEINTHAGTLFGVYDILENTLGVRWLWPGRLGEIIPSRKNLSLPELNASVRPLLWFKEWRSLDLLGSDEKSQRFAKAEKTWLRRQRFGRSAQPSYGHSFGEYWARFGTTHPEYFQMLPDGSRRMDPNRIGRPDVVHMDISEPRLWQQIIDDWKARGSREFLNICENDSDGGCCCPKCLSWDELDPDNPVPFDQRVAAAKEVFDGRKGDDPGSWPLQLGSLSDRYATFWKTVAGEAQKSRPDVKVVAYVYDNYRKPPMKAMLNEHVLCGVVPSGVFYNEGESDTFRHDWGGWSKTGAKLFLRPNYTLQGSGYPLFYARTLGEDLKFAMAHSMAGADFDSQTGQYSTQGPTLYMLAKILNHPDAPVEVVLDEFCSAFGPARGAVKEYFNYWESVYPQWVVKEPDWIPVEMARLENAKQKYGATDDWWSFFVPGGDIYTPDIIARGWGILEKARKQAANDPVASARVEWLAKGLEQVDLVTAAQKAFEHAVDTGDRAQFDTARTVLADFRERNWDDCISNFGVLSANEKRVWKKLDR